jgi:hypothetical protein
VVNKKNLPTQHQGSIFLQQIFIFHLISTKYVLKQVLTFLFMIIARDKKKKKKNGSINPKLIKIKYTEAKAKRSHNIHHNH